MNILNTDDLILEAIEQYRKSLEEPVVKIASPPADETKPEEPKPDSKKSSNKMVGGLQDNGGHGYSNSQWDNYYGADGMDTAIDPNNSNLYYGFIQNGSGLYISNASGANLTANISGPEYSLLSNSLRVINAHVIRPTHFPSL